MQNQCGFQISIAELEVIIRVSIVQGACFQVNYSQGIKHLYIVSFKRLFS